MALRKGILIMLRLPAALSVINVLNASGTSERQVQGKRVYNLYYLSSFDLPWSATVIIALQPDTGKTWKQIKND